MNKRIYLSSPTMHEEEIEYIKKAFESNWIAPLGPNVDGFEKAVAAYVGIRHAAALSSGTAALHLAVKLAGVGAGDVVFCPSFTFSATVNPVLYEKGTPVFIDSERDSWNMDPKALEKAFSLYPAVKAVLLVHLYGVPAKVSEIKEICDRHQVPLIEDAAESMGAACQGKQTGTFGQYGIFSFNGNKIITTSGGGMLVSEEKEKVEKARFWATQSREPVPHYEHKEIGYNYRMSNVLAGIGLGQMEHLDHHIARKRELYHYYKEALSDIPVISMNPYLPDTTPSFWLSCMTIEKPCPVTPAMILGAFKRENIEARPVWKPLHLQPIFKDCDFVQAEKECVCGDLFERGICLPSDIKNSEEDLKRIIKTVRRLFP